jgi:hypothetical protein
VKVEDADVALIRALYAAAAALGRRFPGRPFRPDGHPVGSIGEILAAHIFGLELMPPSCKAYDAIHRPSGRRVEVKLTGGKMSVAIRDHAFEDYPEHLIALRLPASGPLEVIFNGPYAIALSVAAPPAKNGQRRISLPKLRGLNGRLAEHEQLQVVAMPPAL